MTRQPRTQRQRIALTVGSIVLLLAVLGAAGAGYTSYRVNRFASNAFRDDATPPQTQFNANTPTLAPAPGPTRSEPTGTPDPNALLTPTTPPTATPSSPPTATPLPVGNSAVIKRLRAGERVTVLLLGFGGPGHDGGYLTDSIQVLSFDPRGGVATLISVPRDLWVFIPVFEGRGGYWGKINEAYTVGMGKVDRNQQRVPYRTHEQGGALASKVVAQVLGIPIDYWVSLDFVGFRQFIDALGGVDVFVERAFTDTRYPNNDDADVDPSYRTVRFDCGWQRLNGDRAIEFARSRHSPEDGSDFGRARRQQILLTAVKEQIFRVDTIPKAFGLLDALEYHFFTSFSFSEARDLAGWAQEQARDKRPIAIRTSAIDERLLVASTSSGGAYIFLPLAGQGEYSAIQRYVGDLLGARGLRTPSASDTPGAPGTPGTPEALLTPTTAETPSPTTTAGTGRNATATAGTAASGTATITPLGSCGSR